MRVWLLTWDAEPDGIADDIPLRDALLQRGVDVRWVVWNDPGLDWTEADRVLLRTTWDYVARLTEFRAVLEHPALAPRLVNPVAVVRWNLDKIYLAQLAERGVPVVPTTWIEPGATRTGEVTGMSREVVLKPRISSGGRRSLRLPREAARVLRLDPEVHGGWLAQPLLESVLESGEVSVVYIDGAFTHAVRKLPARGEYRVQSRHGGTVEACELRADQLRVAEAAIAALEGQVSYARVDLVEDEKGQPLVIELELIEPELFFRFGTLAAARLAHALVRTESAAADVQA